MQIANAKSGMRLQFSVEDHKLLSNNQKQDHFWIEFNPKSIDRFLVISSKEFPNSSSITFYDNKSKTYPFFSTLAAGATRRWIGLKDLPKFSPEAVVINPQNTHDGVLYFVHRPAMERAPNAGRLRKKPDPVLEHKNNNTNSGGLPLVEPKTELISSEEVRRLTLKHAVDVINQAKAEFGEGMRLEITPKGNLVMMMIYGGE